MIDAEGATAAVESLSYSVVLEVVSPGISHKTEVGGIRLDLRSPEAVRADTECFSRASPLWH